MLYDISRYKDEDIKGHVQLKIILSILRDIFSDDAKKMYSTIINAAKYLSELEDRNTGLEYFEIYVRYIFSSYKDMTRDDFENIAKEIEKTFIEGSEKIMTLADMFREEGMQKGIEKGIEKGTQAGKKEALEKSVLKLLTKKFGILPRDVKEKIENFDLLTLELLFDDALDFTNIDEINKYFEK